MPTLLCHCLQGSLASAACAVGSLANMQKTNIANRRIWFRVKLIYARRSAEHFLLSQTRQRTQNRSATSCTKHCQYRVKEILVVVKMCFQFTPLQDFVRRRGDGHAALARIARSLTARGFALRQLFHLNLCILGFGVPHLVHSSSSHNLNHTPTPSGSGFSFDCAARNSMEKSPPFLRQAGWKGHATSGLLFRVGNLWFGFP